MVDLILLLQFLTSQMTGRVVHGFDLRLYFVEIFLQITYLKQK